MCEILVKAIDQTHKDPDKDRMGCYKKHMPHSVEEDSHVWGRQQSKDVWDIEVRSWPCVALESGDVQITSVVTDDATIPGHLVGTLFGTNGVINHQTRYRYEDYIVLDDSIEELWYDDSGLDIQPPILIDPLLGKSEYRSKKAFVYETTFLTFESKVDVGTDRIDLINDPLLWPAKFYIVKVPGVPPADMQKYCEEEHVGGELYRRREWHIDEGLLTPTQLSNITLSNELTLSNQKAADDIMSRISG